MATYAIGDVQGCLEPLQRLLDKINYDSSKDELWFAGDLVNRGSESLATLQLIRSLPNTVIVFGNHDLHAMACFYGSETPGREDTLDELLAYKEFPEILNWWRQKAVMLHFDADFNALLTHAGIPPEWDLPVAQRAAKQVEAVIRSEQDWLQFLPKMYGDTPSLWSEALDPTDQIRFAINALTRMRLVDAQNRLEFKIKKPLAETPAGFFPWFSRLHPSFSHQEIKLLFGHWAALEGQCPVPNCIALDSGCVWGGFLAAYRLDDGMRFEVPLI